MRYHGRMDNALDGSLIISSNHRVGYSSPDAHKKVIAEIGIVHQMRILEGLPPHKMV